MAALVVSLASDRASADVRSALLAPEAHLVVLGTFVEGARGECGGQT